MPRDRLPPIDIEGTLIERNHENKDSARGAHHGPSARLNVTRDRGTSYVKRV